ncbi:hypothetical protein D3C72_2219600 [compost metagenome]
MDRSASLWKRQGLTCMSSAPMRVSLFLSMQLHTMRSSFWAVSRTLLTTCFIPIFQTSHF